MKPRLRERALGLRNAWAQLLVTGGRARHRGPVLFPLAAEAATPGDRMELNCVVFSKDRAMQLDACLRSIERLAPYTGGPVVVIYRATNEAFADGYRRLADHDGVRFIEQGDDFGADVMGALDPRRPFSVFHTDDDVFFRRPPAAPVLPEGFAAFSLRLGVNTTSYYMGRRSQALPPAAARGELMAWDWTRAEGDFGYPLSLDGHVLSTAWLRSALAQASFDNPNQLEEELHLRRHRAPRGMLSFRESCLLSIPANVVSNTHRNRALGDPGVSAAALNDRFLAGERINLDAMDFSAVHGAHQEIDYVFTSSAT